MSLTYHGVISRSLSRDDEDEEDVDERDGQADDRDRVGHGRLDLLGQFDRGLEVTGNLAENFRQAAAGLTGLCARARAVRRAGRPGRRAPAAQPAGALAHLVRRARPRLARAGGRLPVQRHRPHVRRRRRRHGRGAGAHQAGRALAGARHTRAAVRTPCAQPARALPVLAHRHDGPLGVRGVRRVAQEVVELKD